MKRLTYFDNAKGILIIFIVLAHVFSLCSNYYSYNDDFFKFASLFMLQSFFIISAFFSSKSKKKKTKKILSLLKIYLIWQTIITIYYAFFLKIIDFNFNYLVPRYTLWFLITLISYTLMDYILDKIDYKIMIPLAFIIGLISGFIPIFEETLSLSRTFTFLPFYVLGYYANKIDLFTKIKSVKVKQISIIISIIILIMILLFDNILSIKILKGKYNYYSIDSLTTIEAFTQRIIFYISSIPVTFAFFNLIPKTTSILTKIGKNTLYIYLTQGLILKTFITEKILINNEIIGTILLFLIALFLAVIITKIINKIKVIRKYKLEVLNG